MNAKDPRQVPEQKAEKKVFVPRWLQRARDGALYGYDTNGKPIAGKDTTGMVAL